jgi:hypothetical protein
MHRQFLAVTLLGAATLAHAGPKPEQVAAARAQVAMEPWLSLMDAGEYEKTWDESSKALQASVTRDKWAEASKKLREPLGKLVSRKLFSAKYTAKIHGAPQGKYVILEYDSTFEKKGAMVETLTPMLEADGTWRASGYYVK